MKQKKPDHVPGPYEEAALRRYYERGSKEAVERNHWRWGAMAAMLGSFLMGAANIALVMRSEVQVMQVSKGDGGALLVSGIAKRFSPDEESQAAWASDYAQVLTEVSPAIWQRNVSKILSLSNGVARDQAKAYLQQAGNNPAVLLDKLPNYVREFHRKSVNKVADNTYLVRYELINRPGPGVASESKAYAMTVTMAFTGHRTSEDVFNNPAGLSAQSFSLSDESIKK